MSQFDLDEPLTSSARPATNATLTIRIVKSFPYRNVKNYILRDVNLRELTAHDLLDKVVQIINTTGSLRPYRNVVYDSLKIYTHAHGSKTMNLVINLDHDDWVLDVNSSKKLIDYGIENETELSIYNKADYGEFASNPQELW
ncbi:unnamed protein product [Kuraishia capsulata CBS 1993]|uniref:Altered inheritance rate of mitochondria protein 29 n=1 Tax=Kuraishia capsulata CBS 1993 TaxID=1382522 RepID=W6MLC5_9ASCO|nr:uncharacterized protein KUCA_T00001562001 [Kuraishia capsulata CBS 1993]CDK25592.1 unnamed protein product [Kuraishia capsulata CBS 1993]